MFIQNNEHHTWSAVSCRVGKTGPRSTQKYTPLPGLLVTKYLAILLIIIISRDLSVQTANPNIILVPLATGFPSKYCRPPEINFIENLL